MKFPEKPTCHGDTSQGGVFKFPEPSWHAVEAGPGQGHPDNDGPFRPFRTCSYCGSIHPEDLIKALQDGAKLEVSDFKYGWPHKFYVAGISHAYEGVEVVTGSTYQNGTRTVTNRSPMGKAWGKWYNEHLNDAGLDDEAFQAIAGLLLQHTGIQFVREGDRLRWRRGPAMPAPGQPGIA